MSQDVLVRKILILAANPKGTDKLRLDEEARDIKEGLRQSRERDRFIIDSEWAVRPRDVRRTILYSKPQIVHFSGHGTEDGGLAFENEAGQIQLVQPEALAGLFKLLSSFVECVILNACYSEIQASAIAQHVDFVIGMNKGIGDRAAIEFSVGFYDALGAGCSVEVAYEFGCNAIQMAGIPEHLTPVLKCKSNSSEVCNIAVLPESNYTKDLMTRSIKLEAPLKTVYEFVLTGSIDEVSKHRLEAIVTHLQEITGDTSLTLLRIEPGSIKLILEGSEEGFRLLEERFTSGELEKILGATVQRISRIEVQKFSLIKDEVQQSELEMLFLPRTSQEQEEFAGLLCKFCRDQGFSWVNTFEILKIIKDSFISRTRETIELAFTNLLYPENMSTLVRSNISSKNIEAASQAQSNEKVELVNVMVKKLIDFYEGVS